jgi:hypothetical protein
MPDKELALANQALIAGNLAASEVICRDILDAVPDNPVAQNLLGIISSKVGAIDHARRHFEAALAASPQSQVLRRNLERLSHAVSSGPTGEPRYLLIKAWGCGLWSDISHVLGSLLLAEITGRIPVTHLGRNSLFRDEAGRDVFQNYFEPVSPVSLGDLLHLENPTFFPSKWSRANLEEEDVFKWNGPGSRLGALYFLNRPETIAVSDFYVGVVYVQPWIPSAHPMHGKPLDEIYRYLVGKYLRLNAPAQAACDAFYARHLEGAPFLAAHMRGTDKILEDGNVYATHEACMAELAALDPAWRIFVLTDDEPIAARLKALYGGRIILADCQRSNSQLGVHFQPRLDRFKAGLEVVIDTFLGMRADRFIGNGRSNISTIIAAVKARQPGHCKLFGSNMLAERNLFIFTAAV